MPRKCQWGKCQHRTLKNARFCNCPGCPCRSLDKAERRAEARNRQRFSIQRDGYQVIVRNMKAAVALAQELAEELDRERHR